jgi:hypothetical protein
MPALWARPVHHGVVQPGVAQLEVHPVAPTSINPKDVAAFATIDGPSIGLLRERGSLARGDQRPARHAVTASLLKLPPSSSQRPTSESSPAAAPLRSGI